MRRRKKIAAILASLALAGGQTFKDEALSLWAAGDVSGALAACERILKEYPRDDEALFLKMKALFVQGKYRESVAVAERISDSATSAVNTAGLAVAACIHLEDYNQASEWAEKTDDWDKAGVLEMALRPPAVEADRTYILNFLEEMSPPSDFWPALGGRINGTGVHLRFDTGAPFLVMGKKAAETLGITPREEGRGEHGTAPVNLWAATADSLAFDDGPAFRNVPVVIMADLGEIVIFGTKIIEKFLATVDYPNRRFILTPRGRPDLVRRHEALLPVGEKKIPFYLWSDHYLIAKGRFAGHEGLNLFFDSGLVALTEIDGRTVQAAFTASRESLLKWGFAESDLNQARFFPTGYALEAAGLRQEKTLIWYDPNLKKDRNFGGIRIDGLISHAWLKNYSWTIDFDKFEFRFGIPE